MLFQNVMAIRMNELTSTEQVPTPAVLESLASELQAMRDHLVASEAERK